MKFDTLLFIIVGGMFGLAIRSYQNISCENLSTALNLCTSSTQLALAIVIIVGLIWIFLGINTFYFKKQKGSQSNTSEMQK